MQALEGSEAFDSSESRAAAAPAAGIDMRRVMLTPKSMEEAFVLLVRPEAPAR